MPAGTNHSISIPALEVAATMIGDSTTVTVDNGGSDTYTIGDSNTFTIDNNGSGVLIDSTTVTIDDNGEQPESGSDSSGVDQPNSASDGMDQARNQQAMLASISTMTGTVVSAAAANKRPREVLAHGHEYAYFLVLACIFAASVAEMSAVYWVSLDGRGRRAAGNKIIGGSLLLLVLLVAVLLPAVLTY